MIIIPMVGRSRRFLDAGYSVPKYKLELEGVSVFSLAIGGFRDVALKEGMAVVCLREDNVSEFIRSEAKKLAMENVRIIELPAMTEGQADTVYQAIEVLDLLPDQSLTIFNVDTFRPDFAYPTAFNKDDVDGYLECFIGSGANWSNVVPDERGDRRVIKTSEKKQESKYCCSGLYYFRSADQFKRAYHAELLNRERQKGPSSELFVAPIYNNLICGGFTVNYNVISLDDVIFCGVPSEYESLRKLRPANLKRLAAKVSSREKS